MIDPVLCYVDDNWAYFTTQDLADQWGDDWDDAPYEHNAETPYDPCWHNEPRHVAKRGGLCGCSPCLRDWTVDGKPRWEIIKVAFDGPFNRPADGHLNSPYSVQQINSGEVPWLRTSEYSNAQPVAIAAGTTLVKFCELIRRGNGTVYLATEFPQGLRTPVVC
jgi:hypothetical protein